MRATAAVSFVFVGLVAVVVQGLDHVKFGASRVIQPNPCGHERTGEEGVCMFAWDCLNLNGTHITFCRDRFYYGSCCKLPDGIQPPNRMPPSSFHNPPSNHLDATTRPPTAAPQQPTTTPDAVEISFVKDMVTSRPPVVEVQFPRDPTPRPTIPPAVPTLYPIVPPTTQRKPIVVNNHHKKPGYPLKGTTLSPTPRPRPTEEVTTMAITEVPTGKPTWIVADEADKNGHPTPATAEGTLSTAAASPATITTTTTTTTTSTEQPSSDAPTTTTAPAAITSATTVLQPAAGTETTQRPTEEFTQAAITPVHVVTIPPAEITTSIAGDPPKTTTVESHDENSIDVTTEMYETTTRIFSTRYPIRFPPKERPTTTTEQAEVASTQESVTDPKVIEGETTTAAASTDAGASTTATEFPTGSTYLPPSTVGPSSEADADQTTTPPATSTDIGTRPVPTTTAVPASEVTTTSTGPTTMEAGAETTVTPVGETATPAEVAVSSTETLPTSPSTVANTEASSSPEPSEEPMDVKETTTTPSPPETTTLIPETTTEYDPIKAICGRPKSFASGRIVGGDLTRFGKWPWMISLRQFKKNTFVHKCGAALLNEYWAVSAAHCVHNVSPNDILLRLGEYDLSGHDKEPLGHIERRVQIVATHPKFDAHTFEYDLALMRFYEPVSFADNIVPICIADGNKTYVSQSAVVTGWGRLYEDGPLPSVLQKVQVPIITNKECERMYRKAGFIEDIPDIFICAGLSSGGKDSCEGDSGGPLVLRDEDTGSWNLIGIISWGIGCAVPNQPGVYTRITKFADWMKQIIVF